ncbi:ABC transporter substrate-binding protein [Roseovarius sp. 2305UL8-3]|uniref:ABC transporter substrate-binding protein n=1 Tax=Roseovarius conchicola TaxID=3121636 RepID=UPI003528103A
MKSNRPDQHEIRRMREGYETGRLSRRHFLQGLTAMGLTVAGASALVGSATPAFAETPKKGGRLRLAWNSTGPQDTLDPPLFSSSLDYIRGRAYYNALTRFNPDMSLRPDLAEEWSVSADGLEWTFKLRKDVKFHDGSPFTADDAVYSMNRHLGEGSVSKMASLVSNVAEWKKVDNHTVKAVLATPNADLPVILATFHFKIVKDGAAGDYFNMPAGTGPFKVTEFQPGIRSLGVRNEDYFGGEVYLDEIETFGITDGVARMNALLAGDVDMIGALDPKAAAQVQSADGVDLWETNTGSFSGITFMADREPGNNPDFIMGMKLLANRPRIVESIMQGYASVANDHPIGPAYGADHCSELAQREFDADQAKHHFEKSGLSGATIEVTELDPGITDTCLLLQREAQKIGFNLEVKRVPADGYWGNIWMNRPGFVTGWNMRPTAGIMMSALYKSDASWNESVFKNEHFDALLAESQVVQDDGLRHELHCEMQTIVHDTSSLIIPHHFNFIDAKASKVKGTTSVAVGALGAGEWMDQVWIDS